MNLKSKCEGGIGHLHIVAYMSHTTLLINVIKGHTVNIFLIAPTSSYQFDLNVCVFQHD